MSIYFTLIVESTENANLTVVKTCLPCRWPSRAQVESGMIRNIFLGFFCAGTHYKGKYSEKIPQNKNLRVGLCICVYPSLLTEGCKPPQ